ncbi:MAG TPA: M48 family metallopeptidase [Dissulfurispiraceae bacterium]|nr:M48 family metallopeptidase [Dissulfurispiraceae bacterium]
MNLSHLEDFDSVIPAIQASGGIFSSAGRITLNLSLIKAPKECIDYVICHELCHFKEKHHGPRFWTLMRRLLPDYERRRIRLNLYAE